MKEIEKLAKDYAKDRLDQDYFDVSEAYSAGFRKAREMAADIAETERGAISGAVAGRIQCAIIRMGEYETLEGTSKPLLQAAKPRLN